VNLAVGLLKAMRPHQWTKNLFVFAPLLFAGGKPLGETLRVVAAFGIFCLCASGIYMVNDVFDREADRLHPRKQHRPIASGVVPVPLALAWGALLMAGALAWAGWFPFGLESKEVTVICGTYVAIQLAYAVRLKHLVILDVLCISSGFVLRLLAGGVSFWGELSEWIVLCTVFLSLFLGLCKRRHEVVSLGEDAEGHRLTLGHYPVSLLDQLIGIVSAAALVTYALYTVDRRTLLAHHLVDPALAADPSKGILSPLLLTLPFVIYGLARYLYLVYHREQGGSPTTTLLRDVPSLVNGLLYAASVVAIFKFAHV
jgi:4-hydroxybenzoate polyprenyltransferase